MSPRCHGPSLGFSMEISIISIVDSHTPAGNARCVVDEMSTNCGPPSAGLPASSLASSSLLAPDCEGSVGDVRAM